MSSYGRLRSQAEVLEPLSDRALARLGPLDGVRALDVACGAMGLLGPLSRRVGGGGAVVGSDVNEVMVEHARAIAEARTASARPDTYGVTFTLMQVWARSPR